MERAHSIWRAQDEGLAAMRRIVPILPTKLVSLLALDAFLSSQQTGPTLCLAILQQAKPRKYLLLPQVGDADSVE